MFGTSLLVHWKGITCTIVYVVLPFLLQVQAESGDLFSTVHIMENLARQELHLLMTLENYVVKQQSMLNILTNKLDQLRKVRPRDLTVQEVIGDPITAYTLMRRLTREWPLILSMMPNNIDLQWALSSLPGEEGLQSAMKGIARLQETYRLSSTDLAHQTIGSAHLTALDVFEIGSYFLRKGQFEISESWFHEAYRKVVHNDSTVDRDKILSHLFLAIFNSGCVDGKRLGSARANNVLQDLMYHHPNFTLDEYSSPIFREVLSTRCPTEPSEPAESKRLHTKDYYSELYHASCREQLTNISSETKCLYVHYNNPKLLIAPFKVEEINVNPPLLMFHDVISDQEIAEMITEFKKVRRPCTTYNGSDSVVNDSHRTCSVGWVEGETETFHRLTRRMGDMTNLDMETSELNQVASYGLAGEFKLHGDHLSGDSLAKSVEGGRLATLMFYMNEVAEGGHTAYPLLQKSVKPLRGSAVFWYNLDHSGNELQTMLHGGCPVMKGSKWVLNKWIHEGKQRGEMFCPTDEIFPRPRYYMNGVQ